MHSKDTQVDNELKSYGFYMNLLIIKYHYSIKMTKK